MPGRPEEMVKDLYVKEKRVPEECENWHPSCSRRIVRQSVAWASAPEGWGWVDCRDLKNDSVLYPEGRAGQNTL